ncbi:MAG: hypothetical protein RSC43_00105 [Clostridia bacterium]
MNLNETSFKEQLKAQGLGDALDTAIAAEAPVAEVAKTSEFLAGDGDKEARKAKYQKKAALTSSIAEKIKSKATQLNSPEGHLLATLTRNSAICCYVSKHGPKTDFYIKTCKVKSASDGKEVVDYKIGLRQSAPSAPVAAIVRYPAACKDLLESDTKLTDVLVEGATADITLTVLQSVPRDQWATMLNTTCQGFMPEDPALFEPYYTKKSKIATPSDVKGRDGVSARPGMYLQLNRKIMSIDAADRNEAVDSGIEKMFDVKHTYRTRFQTPKNTICLSRYRTRKLQMQYSADDAANMIHLYLSRFSNAKDANNKNKISILNRAVQDLFKVDPETNQIKATAYFPLTSADSFTHKPGTAVMHWYNHNTDGSPMEIPFDEIELVRKEEFTSAKGNPSIRVMKDDLKDVTASSDTYRLDPNGEHAAIFTAARGKLTYEDVMYASRTTTKSKSGKPRMIPTVAGSDLAGCTPEELRAIIKQITDLS